MYRSSVTINPSRRLLSIGALLLVLLTLLWPSTIALADAPITRGPDTLPQGGLGTAPVEAAAGGVDPTAAWRGVQMLPPPTSPAAAAGAPSMFPAAQDGGSGGSSAIAWLGRQINPGNWILDAGMGIFAGIVKMFGGIVQKAVATFLGNAPDPAATFRADDAPAPAWSVIPDGCDNAATNFVFCTPANLTYAHPGVKTVWAVLRGIAAGLVTILFTVRLGRLIVEGPRSLASEGKGLLLTFLGAMTFIQVTGPICQLLVEFFNGLSTLLLSRAALALPSQDVGDLNLGSNILFLVLWVLILLLIFKSFGRLVQIIMLLAMAPLAGALLMDRATSNRFRSWFEKLIELLLAQINLVIIFIVIAAILQPYEGRSFGDAFVGFLLSIVMMGMALNGTSVIGIAGSAMGGGSYLKSMLMMSTLGAGAGMGARLLGRGAGALARGVKAGLARGRGTSLADVVGAPISGDPMQSAAAQRGAGPSPHGGGSGGGFSPGALRPDHLAGAFSGSFRDAYHGTKGAAKRAQRLEAAHEQLQTARGAARLGRASGDGALVARARRERAEAQAVLLRDKADHLGKQARAARANGFSAQANQFEQQRARRLRQVAAHEQIARSGEVPYKPGRWGTRQADGTFALNEAGAARRAAYQAALSDTTGMQALERPHLDRRIAGDEARAAELPRQIARNTAVGQARVERYTAQGRPERAALAQRVAAERDRRLHAEQADVQARLATNHARRDALQPAAGSQHAPATRRAAIALANERLPDAQRIGPAGTGEADLRAARAGAGQTAARPPSQRASGAPRSNDRGDGGPRPPRAPGLARPSAPPRRRIATVRGNRTAGESSIPTGTGRRRRGRDGGER